ncbi:RILP-like protein homolog isoform X1 [Metopolophium dirhodum]|uniref:RILP-like protein homolog isoform X1 n=1 Tax=Metopolophium dirhodum TaxID=44670 RepID=UPI00298FC069|nr:RILP-like protein homolog isoform X1 [Metopolophium dirhodum]
MLLHVFGTSKMDNYKCSLSVVDVYDMAQDIGREFESIIDAYGTDAITGLMPKVVSALEQMEILAMKNERENTTVDDLRATIQQLEMDKQERTEDRIKYEKEMEQIEDKWREDYNELLTTVSRLQDDNRKLTESLQAAEKDKIVDSKSQVLSPDVDTVALQRLRHTVDQMRDSIRSYEHQLYSKSNEVDSLNVQMDRLQTTLKDLRRKHRFAQLQCRGLVEERADILSQLQKQQKEFISLRQRFGVAQKENEDLSKYRDDLPDLKNKAIYDLDDPDRPKFTTNELKDILTERNELKTRVNDLEDELLQYRPVEQSTISQERDEIQETRVRRILLRNCTTRTDSDRQNPDTTPGDKEDTQVSIITPEISSDVTSPIRSDDEQEEGPVQGPLPLEPDDAPWKRNPESGIRKLFRKMFAETNNSLFSKTSPKHPKLSLSKMAVSIGHSSIMGPSEV